MMGSHNWALMYRQNFNMRRLFKRWRSLQLAYSRSGSDQVPRSGVLDQSAFHQLKGCFKLFARPASRYCVCRPQLPCELL